MDNQAATVKWVFTTACRGRMCIN